MLDTIKISDSHLQVLLHGYNHVFNRTLQSRIMELSKDYDLFDNPDRIYTEIEYSTGKPLSFWLDVLKCTYDY